MSKKDLIKKLKKIDFEKFSVLDDNCAFEFVILDKTTGDFYHTGIGDGADMSLMNLYELASLYESACPKDEVDIEEFAKSVSDSLVKFYKDGLVKIDKGVH